MMNLRDLRQDYSGTELLEKNCPPDPLELFRTWFQESLEGIGGDVNAMVLATADAEGRPASRVVLLKELDHGFVWFTNYGSAKASDLEKNPHAALTFWWEFFSRQVRVQGRVEKVSATESDAYFQSRPAGSRAGAIASVQSSIISGREELDRRYQELISKPESELQRPENWGGYRLIPEIIEFWQGRESRMHDRIRYRLEENVWVKERLSP
jgi:pyridoxamine 5'-phosphate oxidase